MDFANITDLMDSEAFEKTKAFILENGDKMTFRNFDNHNPHYKFSNCDAFLGADIGQRNINNDPRVSDFNELTIVDRNAVIQYHHVIIVRKGDLAAEKVWIQKDMKEGHVYLLDMYNSGLEAMKSSLQQYLNQIRKTITTHDLL